MGIVTEVVPATGEEPAKVVVVGAGADGKVQSVTYGLDDEGILGYGLLSEKVEQPERTDVIENEKDPEVVVTDEPSAEKNNDTVTLDNTLTYEAEDYTVAVKVSGEATVADGSEPAPEPDGLTMNTTALDASARR